jgi:hypothetical protein
MEKNSPSSDTMYQGTVISYIEGVGNSDALETISMSGPF